MSTPSAGLLQAAPLSKWFASYSSLWQEDPWFYGVVIQRESANLVESFSVPHVLGVEARSDTPDQLASVVRIQRRRRRKPRENLPAARGIYVGVIVPPEVHPEFVVSPTPLSDVLLAHDVGQREPRRRCRHNLGRREERCFLCRSDLRRSLTCVLIARIHEI